MAGDVRRFALIFGQKAYDICSAVCRPAPAPATAGNNWASNENGAKRNMTNIFVGNLDPGMTEDQLRKLFESYGTVETVTVVTDRDTGQSRGFAFVEMASDKEAKTAIETLHGALWEGRRIDVNEARPKSERGNPVEQRKHSRDALDTRKHRQHRL